MIIVNLNHTRGKRKSLLFWPTLYSIVDGHRSGFLKHYMWLCYTNLAS